MRHRQIRNIARPDLVGPFDRYTRVHRAAWCSVKYEEVCLRAYMNGTEARMAPGRYFRIYNAVRSHQSLKYRTPVLKDCEWLCSEQLGACRNVDLGKLRG